jgi:hypothetical protein
LAEHLHNSDRCSGRNPLQPAIKMLSNQMPRQTQRWHASSTLQRTLTHLFTFKLL